jgi:uncharacterized protein
MPDKQTFLKRFYTNKLDGLTKSGKVLVIYGPRRVGKTTLVQDYLSNYQGKIYQSSGDDAQLRDVLETQEFSKIIPYFKDYDLVFIDEAQRIEEVGYSLKILVDQIPNLKVIATGSSSFDLADKMGEPLVGRQKIIKLFPLSAMELRENFGGMYLKQNLENLLIYGSYPEVIISNSYQEKVDYLRQIRDSYLFKDILELYDIRNSKKILDLLRLIAFQIGKEVSLHELGKQLELSKNTVERYLDLLEKSFVLINVRGFSRNLRKEIVKTSRYYFFDTGVRNAVISNFNLFSQRDDIGQLWENYLFIERIKKNSYLNKDINSYFWRTYQQQEIDLVEEEAGKLCGYEFKWNKDKISAPPSWRQAYPQAKFEVVNQENFLNFIG